MVKRIASQFKDDLLSRVDIVSVINARVPLKKAGNNFKACCPFHNEKTPSFTVSAQKQFYHCFGCGVNGNAIDFLMDFEHLQFVEAIEKLAEENGITVEYEQLSAASIVKEKRRRTLHEVLEGAAALYERNLYDSTVGKSVRAYLHERQLDKETVSFFRLGYSQGGNRLSGYFGREVAVEDLQKAGLQARGDNGSYDFFRERLMFPIRDPRGRVLGFGARALGDVQPKYLNTSDTELFNKSNIVYGLYEELQTNQNIEYLIIVEGYMDVIALHQMGVAGAVAALGTAFTQGHLNLVRRYTKKLFICFDGDNAGRRAAQRAMSMVLPAMSLDTEIRMVFLPEGEDPDTLVRKVGRAAFLQILGQGQLFSEFVYDSLIDGSDLSFVEGRGEVAQRAKALFDDLPDGEYKTILYQGLTERIGMDVYQLVQPIGRSVPTSARYGVRRTMSAARAPYPIGGAEARLIRLLMDNPALSRYVPHHELLYLSDNDESLLLYRVLQFFQCYSGDRQTAIAVLLTAFDGGQQTILKNIADAEVKVVAGEASAATEQRLKTEFFDGMQVLLDECLRKIYFR